MIKYKDLAQKINKEELEKFYKGHLPWETMNKFDICSYYLLKKILQYFNIKAHTSQENTYIQMQNMTESEKIARGNKISQSNMGRTLSEETREKISISNKNNPIKRQANKTSFKKGQKSWNKGQKGLQHWLVDTSKKRYETMKRNHTFNTSKPEEEMYKKLCEEYGVENIRRQYKEERYPYACDFYIPSEDLFIELNFHWTHGGMLYEENNPQCQEKLKEWEEKAKTSKYYLDAIITWTIRDVNKRRCAKKNNLNYLEIF